MATNTKKPKQAKQGHKLVWFTAIVIAIPFLVVGIVLLTSLGGKGQPVVGNRYQKQDLDPKIMEQSIQSIQEQAAQIGGVEEASANLKSATLRLHLNMDDSYNQDQIQAAADQAYEVIAANLPIDQYFTNREDAKMYDLEVDVYNYIVDETHSADGQIFIKKSKSGASQPINEVLTSPKDPELVGQIKR